MNPPVPAPLPELWNPNAAVNWSLLLSPAFGSFLHARNAETLGHTSEAKAHWAWFRISIAYFVCNLGTIFIPAIPDALFRLVGLGILLGWYLTAGKQQANNVKQALGNQYVRKPWSKPLLIGFACLIGYAALAICLAAAASLITGSNLF